MVGKKVFGKLGWNKWVGERIGVRIGKKETEKKRMGNSGRTKFKLSWRGQILDELTS